MSHAFEGTLLGDRWRIGPKLGHGQQGDTYLARDEKAPNERVVVVKTLSLARGSWKKFDLFEREAAVLKALRHKGIPRYLDQIEGEPAGTFYLVMEKAPGATLRSIATRVHFTERELKDIGARVLEILMYLHARKPPVIHRDIKPANLLRASDGQISLVDFGGVRAALRESGGSTVVGTFGYMAPEQLHGEATPKTDLYGLGATLVALAGGCEPEDVPRNGLRMDLARHLPGVSAPFRALLEALTHPEPSLRPASAAEALVLLRRETLPVPTALAPWRPRLPANQESKWFLEEVNDLPGPVRALTRFLFRVIGVLGYVAITVADVVLVPLVSWLVYSITRIAGGKEDTLKRIAETKIDAQQGLGEGRRLFLDMQRRPTALLPPGSQPKSRRELRAEKHARRREEKARRHRGG